MSAAGALQAALVTALGAADGIAGVVSGVFDGPPARAAYPYITIGEGLTLDWSHKTGRGREHRLAVNVWDEAGRPARLHALIGAAEAAIEALPRDLTGIASPACCSCAAVWRARRAGRGPDWSNIGCARWRFRRGFQQLASQGPFALSLSKCGHIRSGWASTGSARTDFGIISRRILWRRRREARSC